MPETSLAVTVGPLKLKNPVLTASGTFNFGQEYGQYYNLEELGGIMFKGLTANPRPGNPPPRIVETPAGILNSVGLQNPGVEAAIKGELQSLQKYNFVKIANIAGYSVEEYCQVARKLSDSGLVDALEVNISCPNVRGGGLTFGTDPEMVYQVISSLRETTDLPLIAKLTPNVSDVTEIARSAQRAGADILSLINTVTGMAIDAKTRRPVLHNVVGGLSGPAVKPLALRMVWEVAQAVNLPIIGMGGIVTATDAIEFMLAGASAVAVGTGNFLDPYVPLQVIVGLEAYLEEEGLNSISEIVGKLEV